MASSFFGIHVARDALQLAQKSIDLTLNNVANISTPGYSRQRLDICSVALPNHMKSYGTQNLAGMGAEAVGVTQIRDKLLDTKVRKYSGDLCAIGARTSVLGEIEDVLDDVENAETGFAATLGNLKAAFQSFSANSADRRDLANVALNNAKSAASVLKNFDMRIEEVMAGTARDIENTNEKVNQILRQMGDLNKQIKSGYVNMEDIIMEIDNDNYRADVTYGPLELKDTFNRLADELSQYLNVYVTEEKNGTFTVDCRGVTLVREDKYAKTDMKFNPKTDVVTAADGEKLNAAFLEFPVETALYDRNGKRLLDSKGDEVMDPRSTEIPAGTALYFENGTFTGLYSNGKGGFYDENDKAVNQIFNLKCGYPFDENGKPDESAVIAATKYFYADEKGNIMEDPQRPGQDWEVTDLDTVVQGMKVVAQTADGKEFVIDVKGQFDGRCIKADYSELYVSSLNSTDQWRKTEREDYSQLIDVLAKGIKQYEDDVKGNKIDNVTAKKMAEDTIRNFNQLIRDCEVEEAYNFEKDIMELVNLGRAQLNNPEDRAKTYYDPIFRENIIKQAKEEGFDLTTLKMPEYAISISEETGSVTSGSIKGLFDMYNGEGGYCIPEGNNYLGVKYFKETIRTLAKTMTKEFNAIYEDYNNKITLEKYKLENGLQADAELSPAQLKDYEDKKEELIDKYGFEMFEFDGAVTTDNLKVAESWVANALRCVHPEGTEDWNYNYDQLDNAKLNDILEVFTRKVAFTAQDSVKKDKCSLEEFVQKYGQTIGSQLEYELSDFENANLMYKSVDDERESVMGVNMDEEGANMLTYQKWYNAISRMMTALDEMLDKLINGTGRVGL